MTVANPNPASAAKGNSVDLPEVDAAAACFRGAQEDARLPVRARTNSAGS